MQAATCTEIVEDELKEVSLQEKGGKSGAVYVRWGSSTCPGRTVLLYEGRTGGTEWNITGRAANYLCMPHDPEYDIDLVRPGVQGYSYIFGVE